MNRTIDYKLCGLLCLISGVFLLVFTITVFLSDKLFYPYVLLGPSALIGASLSFAVVETISVLLIGRVALDFADELFPPDC